MSSFMIDENKNLVSDKLWEFFATPWSNSAPELNTIQNVEVGEVFQAVCNNFSATSYDWNREWSDGDIFLFKLNNNGSKGISGPFGLSSLYYKYNGIFQILQYENGIEQTQLRPLIAKDEEYDGLINVYIYNGAYVVGIRLA